MLGSRWQSGGPAGVGFGSSGLWYIPTQPKEEAPPDQLEEVFTALEKHLPKEDMSAIRLGAKGSYCARVSEHGCWGIVGVAIKFNSNVYEIREHGPEWSLLERRLGWVCERIGLR